MLPSVLFWIFILSVAIQCGYALYFFTRIFNLPRLKLNPEHPVPPVSIIICARNEANNLRQNLPSVLAQRYTNEDGKLMYEVIVVNDASDDDTEATLQQLEQEYTNLWHVTISKETPRTFKGKKFALGKGVAHASHNCLLLTDADCKPAGDDWLALMTAPLSRGREIAIGYGAFYTAPGLLNAFNRWETMHTFLQYATYTMAGKPYMGVGRNLACTREVFEKAQASAVWNELPSGDDDLLVQACGNAANTTIVGHKNAFTYSEAKNTWAGWVRQKQRHLSTGKYYNARTRSLLGLYALSHALSWLLFFLLFWWSDGSVIFFIFAMRCTLYWTIWHSTASKLRDKKLLLWIPLCDLGWAVYNLCFSPYILWKNKKQWK